MAHGRPPYILVRARDIMYVGSEVERRVVRHRILANNAGLSTFTVVIPTLAVASVEAIDNCKVEHCRRRPKQGTYACKVTLGQELGEGYRGDYSYRIHYKEDNNLPPELRGHSAADMLEEVELIVVFGDQLPKVVYSAEWATPDDSAEIDVDSVQLLTIGEVVVHDSMKATNVSFPFAARMYRRHVPPHTAFGIRWER